MEGFRYRAEARNLQLKDDSRLRARLDPERTLHVPQKYDVRLQDVGLIAQVRV